MPKYAIVKPALIDEVIAELARDREAGGWHGGEPDPTRTAVLRTLHALGRLGYTVHGGAVVESHEYTPPDALQAGANAACAGAPIPHVTQPGETWTVNGQNWTRR